MNLFVASPIWGCVDWTLPISAVGMDCWSHLRKAEAYICGLRLLVRTYMHRLVLTGPSSSGWEETFRQARLALIRAWRPMAVNSTNTQSCPLCSWEPGTSVSVRASNPVSSAMQPPAVAFCHHQEFQQDNIHDKPVSRETYPRMHTKLYILCAETSRIVLSCSPCMGTQLTAPSHTS